MDILILAIQPVLAMVLAPLLPGIINRVKAKFAGRQGQPVMQLYYDLYKLMNKSAVYSTSTSWVFRAAPVICLAAVLMTTLVVPIGHGQAAMAFSGDLILFAYLLAITRFFIVLGAMDTASAFEGMGASREVQFSALAEPALLIALAAMARQAGSLSLGGIFDGISTAVWAQNCATMLLAGAAVVIVLLAENSRIPVDDPNTHLELTMIHEAMVLDNSGPDLAFILYGAAVKLWVLSALLVGLLLPAVGGGFWANAGISVLAIMVTAGAVGIVESCMARLRLLRVPQLLLTAMAMAVLALVFVLRK